MKKYKISSTTSNFKRPNTTQPQHVKLRKGGKNPQLKNPIIADFINIQFRSISKKYQSLTIVS